MEKYTVKFYKRTFSGLDDHANDEIQLILEFEDRRHLTSRDFKCVIDWLFDMSAIGGIDSNRLYAEISRDEQHIFDIFAYSYMDGSSVDCIVSISRDHEFRHYRTMNICS